jgi:hypothetical protein
LFGYFFIDPTDQCVVVVPPPELVCVADLEYPSGNFATPPKRIATIRISLKDVQNEIVFHPKRSGKVLFQSS